MKFVDKVKDLEARIAVLESKGGESEGIKMTEKDFVNAFGSNFRSMLGLSEEALKEEPWPWKPKKGDKLYTVLADGDVYDGEYGDLFGEYELNQGTIFPTRKAAEHRALLIRSLKPSCPVPKEEQDVWVVYADKQVCLFPWKSDSFGHDAYNTGRVHATRESAEAWLEEFKGLFEEAK